MKKAVIVGLAIVAVLLLWLSLVIFRQNYIIDMLNADLESAYAMLDEESQALLEEMNQLQRDWEAVQARIDALEAMRHEATEVAEPIFSHGLTASDIKHQLENDSAFIGFIGENYPNWHPRWEGFTSEDTVRIYKRYAVVEVPTNWGMITAFLSYQVMNGMVHWQVESYNAPGRWEFRPRYIPQPRHLTDLAYVTIGFAYYCFEIDPGINYLPEAWKYHDVEIPGEYLWEEFIRLMRYYSGIRVRDLWIEGTRLYVDLAPVETIVFNWGSTGGWHRSNVLFKTLATFPDITEFIVLVDGVAGVGADHFSF
jgi:hypothetical protein